MAQVVATAVGPVVVGRSPVFRYGPHSAGPARTPDGVRVDFLADLRNGDDVQTDRLAHRAEPFSARVETGTPDNGRGDVSVECRCTTAVLDLDWVAQALSAGRRRVVVPGAPGA
jgi:hypothetical protein